MFQKKDWQKLLALFIFIMVLGGYYDRLSVEVRTMILPLVIILAAAVVVARFKKLEYEMRSSRVLAHDILVQTFTMVDSKGNERVSISANTDHASMTFYDENHSSCATLELLYREPSLKFTGDNGGAWIAFDKDGMPHLSLRGDADEIIWTAP